MRAIPSTAKVKYAAVAGRQHLLKYIDGVADGTDTLPNEGEILLKPFLVHPQSLQPIPVRVVEVRYIPDHWPEVIAVVVDPVELPQ